MEVRAPWLVVVAAAMSAAACGGSDGGGPTDRAWACHEVLQDTSYWQLDGTPPEDVSSIRLAITKLRADLKPITDRRLQRAGRRLAADMAWAADDESRPGLPGADDGAIEAFDGASTQLDLACGYPTEGEDD